MEEAKVAMLAYESGTLDKASELGRLTDQEEFWTELEETPENRLKPIHLELFNKLGIKPPAQGEQAQQEQQDQSEPGDQT